MDKKPKDRMEIVEFDNSDDSFLEQARTQLSALEISYPNTTASDAQLLAATSLTILCDSNACSNNEFQQILFLFLGSFGCAYLRIAFLCERFPILLYRPLIAFCDCV
jgi:hypothetical protein